MPITKLQFKPGINREGTSYAEEGSWYDGDHIRFRSGRPEKMGGWIRATQTAIKGVARVLFNWVTLTSKDCLAIGTSKKFYVEFAGVPYDITPIRYTDTVNNPVTSGSAGGTTHTYTTSAAHGAAVGDFVTISNCANVDGICTSTYTNPFRTTAAGSPYVIVECGTAHYALAGDTVTFSGTTGFDGIPAGDFNTSIVINEVLSTSSFSITVATNATAGGVTGGGSVTAVYLGRLNREFEVLSIPTSTTFTFQTDTPCTTGGVNGGGASVVARFQISPGFSVNIPGPGWGSGTWSRQGWGTALNTVISAISLRIWSVDNYGEDLVFCTRDGPLYYWDASAGFTNNRATLVSAMGGASDVPIQTSIVRVTDDRHVLSIGSTERVSVVFDPLLIRWSDQEDVTNWTPAVTNTSGDARIPLGSYVVAAIVTRQETLIWTDVSLHSLQFTGPPYTFSLQTLAQNTNIAGPNAAINVNNVTYWMGKERFWVYSGRVEVLPCTVQRYVFDDINLDQFAQVYAGTNESFTEVYWFYCSASSQKINRFVCYNYGDNLWCYGTMSRTAWLQCPGRGAYPFATSGGYDLDGENDETASLYLHEYGYDDGSTNPATAISAYIESADFDIQDGDKLVFADRIIPDLTFARSTVDTPSVTVTLEAKKFSGEAIQSQDDRSVSKTVTQTVDQYTDQVWARLRGRQMRMKIASSGAGVCWLLGDVRINMRLDGRQ